MASLRLHQNGDHGSSAQSKGSMLDSSEQGLDGSGVAGEGDEGVLVMGEYVVQEDFEACFLRRVGFAHVGGPEGVELGKSGLKGVCWEGLVDVGFAAASIAGVDSYSFAEELCE